MIDEPYWGFGDTTLRPLIYESWIFTKTFSLQPDFLNLTRFTPQFDQIDTVSNVTLNECFLGNTSSMFFACIFYVPGTCLKSDNVLHVDFMSPGTYAANQAIAYNKTVEPLCPYPVQHGESHVQFIRKEPCSFSWDCVNYIDNLNRHCHPHLLLLSGSSICIYWHHRKRISRSNKYCYFTIKAR